MSHEIFDDLEAEEDQLEQILSGLNDDDWSRRSGASGWTIADVVLHLAQTEEAVVAATTGDSPLPDWGQYGDSVDEVMDTLVRTERGAPEEALRRWRAARRAALAGLRQADPQRPVPWVVSPLKPQTLATTRLAEHWAHALDVTGPLGIHYPDTARLRHVAWLSHHMLPYAFALAGQPAHEVYCELVAPDGDVWRLGSPQAGSAITGPAGTFCRVAAQRLAPEDSGLVTTGPHGDAALRVLRTYAG